MLREMSALKSDVGSETLYMMVEDCKKTLRVLHVKRFRLRKNDLQLVANDDSFKVNVYWRNGFPSTQGEFIGKFAFV